MKRKVSMGDLIDYAEQNGITHDSKSYEELREVVPINECKECSDEFLRGYNESYCSDTCEVEYINRNFR